MSAFRLDTSTKLIVAVVLANLLSIGLLINRIIFSDSDRYAFLLWNAILAAVPAFLAYWLVCRVRKYGWLKPAQLLLGGLWLTFLPNSFYVITDLVHLRPNFEADIFYDIILLSSFWLNGLILGILSIVLVHLELNKRLSVVKSSAVIGTVILISSFAVYLGRFTRWNTWDLLLQPAGLLFDVSDRFVNPAQHPQTFQFTILLFLFFSVTYFIIWQAVNLVKESNLRSKE